MEICRMTQLARLFRNFTLLIFSLTILSLNAFALSGEFFDFHAYMRSGLGTNNKGGDQICFNNPGASAFNEFRLGNECTDYAEVTLAAHNLKAKTSNDQSWKTQILFQHQTNGDTTSETHNLAMREAFVEGQNIFGHNFTYWVGKRFYRDVNSNMNDWYYFADMSGNGAGIGNIDTGFGKLALATVNHTESTQLDIGYPQKKIYDIRLFEIPMWESANLNLWAAHAKAVGGKSGTTTYIDTEGTILAARYRQNMLGGFNDFTILWGDDLLARGDVWGTNPVEKSNIQNRSHKILFVDDMTAKLTNNLEFHMTLAYENKDTGRVTKEQQTWTSMGARPVYFFSDKVSLATEIGRSIVNSEAEAKQRELTKLTIAGQLHPQTGIWVRPVLRAYVSSFKWNNQNNEAGVLWKLKSDQPYVDNNNAYMVGFQGEVWF